MRTGVCFTSKQRSMPWLPLVTICVVALGQAGTAAAAEERVHTLSTTSGTATAAELAEAMDIPAEIITSVSFGTSDAIGGNVFDSTLAGFPTQGESFAAISSGNAADAPMPNTEGNLTTILGGLNNSQGNDLYQLTVTMTPPEDAAFWAIDLKFLSEEFPEFVGTEFNDTMLIETPTSNFVITGDTVTAPNNVAFDAGGNLITINTTGAAGMSAANSAGTTYDGATATLTTVAAIPVQGPLTIIFSIMDLGDELFDSTVFLDNFRFIVPEESPPGVNKTVRIPVRWCVLDGSPSEVDPTLVGETNIKDVLWRRHERVTDNIYLPQAGITLRSGAVEALPDFPVITDLDTGVGSAGQVLDPRFDDGIEWRATINACRAVWRDLAPGVTGLTAVHIDRFVNSAGDTTGLLGVSGLSVSCNTASQLARGDAMVIDNAYLLSTSPLQEFGPDDVDKLLAHELAHGLSLWHGDGVDGDDDGIIDGPPHLTEPGETLDGPNLMQYRFFPPDGIELVSPGQIDRMRTQALVHIPDREVDPEPIPQGGTSVDLLGDTPTDMEFGDINEFGAGFDPDAFVNTFFVNFADLLPAELEGMTVFFVADVDNDPNTGGDPTLVGTPVGTLTGGVDIVIEVFVTVTGGVVETTWNAYQFDDLTGMFVLLDLSDGVVAEVRVETLSLLEDDVNADGTPLEVSNAVEVNIPPELFELPEGIIGLEVFTVAANPGLIDDAVAFVDLETEIFPFCEVLPSTANPGQTVVVGATGMPASVPVKGFLGGDEVHSGASDSEGNVGFSFTIPFDTFGARVVTVGVDDPNNAITADCEVFVSSPPSLDPPTPATGTEFVIQAGQTLMIELAASDPDLDDIVLINGALPDGATLDCDPPGNPTACTFEWTPSGGDVGVTEIPFIASDIFGLFDTSTIVVTVTNQPPVALCQDVSVAADANCQASADVDNGSFDPNGDPIVLTQDPPGPYLLGETVVTLTVEDDSGASASCTATVTVVDETPPELAVTLTPDTLWPPNHHMAQVEATVIASDNCSTPTLVLTSVSSSEADNGTGDGNTVNDIQDAELGTLDFNFELRRERAGGGNGRIYTAIYTATDTAGNASSVAGFAVVPHDQGGMTDPLEVFLNANGDGTLVWWNEVPGVQSYDVIRGQLSSIAETNVAISLGPVTCIEPNSTDESTAGWEDSDLPNPGQAFFYLVKYDDGTSSSYGTESADKPRAPGSGDCQ